jgi:acetylglutamate kinase
MVLIGQVNSELVARLNGLGVRAIGLSGIDGAMLQAQLRDPELGLVGEVTAVDLGPIETLEAGGYIVVVAPVALGPNGQPLNVNADTVAGEIARALAAEKLVFFTDVPGLLDREGRLISELTPAAAARLKAEGVVTGGMIPKVDACLRALDTVPRAHIIDGREPHALIRELFTDRGVGTMIRSSEGRE